MKRSLWILGIFLCLCAVLAPAFLTFSVYSDHADTDPAITETGGDGTIRFLFMGCDQSERLTDSIFLVTVRSDGAPVSILQIPRDTYANYTQKDYKKLNGAWSTLGERGIKTFFSRALGVSVDYFMVLNLKGFDRLVDAVGGVELDVPQDMVYSDPAQGLEISLHAGFNHLDGKMAEQFVRYRAGYPNADLGRMDAQKLFMQAFAKKLGTLSVAQTRRLLMATLTTLQTDFPLPDAMRMLSAFGQSNGEQMRIATLPGQAVRGNSGAWYYAVNKSGACRAVNEYLHPSAPLRENDFDPSGLFDRPENQRFHAIYTAPEEALPLGE